MPTKENSSLPLLISPRLEGENNREYAYRVLRQNIITLQFAPGQTLSEAELSEKLEMSRTPVHEAVMMLKNEARGCAGPARQQRFHDPRGLPARGLQYAADAGSQHHAAAGGPSDHAAAQAVCPPASRRRPKWPTPATRDPRAGSSSRWTTTFISCCTTMAVTTAHGRLCTTSPRTTTGCAT